MDSSIIQNSMGSLQKALMCLTSAMYDPMIHAIVNKDQLRDAWSTGQLISKEWLLREIKRFDIDDVLVVGGWFGLLARAIQFETQAQTTTLDIDGIAHTVASRVMGDPNHSLHADMYKVDYSPYSCVVNTSLEHIGDPRAWSKLVYPDTIVVAQSNNARHIKEHINCVDSADELATSLNLRDIHFAGELVFPMYTRYMVIGTK